MYRVMELFSVIDVFIMSNFGGKPECGFNFGLRPYVTPVKVIRSSIMIQISSFMVMEELFYDLFFSGNWFEKF